MDFKVTESISNVPIETMIDELKREQGDDIATENSLLVEEHPDFFFTLENNFKTGNPEWFAMLTALAEELKQHKLQFYTDFQEYNMSSILISLIESKVVKNVFLSLFIISRLAKSSEEYANSMMYESVHKYIARIITEQDQTTPLTFILQAFECLSAFVSSSLENRDKLLMSLNHMQIAKSVFLFFKDARIIQAYFSFICCILKYQTIQKESFMKLLEVFNKIDHVIERNSVGFYLEALEMLSEYSYSGILIEKNTDILRFLEPSLDERYKIILRRTVNIVKNSIKNGCHLTDAIIAASITYLHCNDYSIINAGNEIVFEVLQHSKIKEAINLDIGILIRNTFEGTSESKISSLDLLVYYLMVRNDKIEEALDNSLLGVVISFLDSDDMELWYKVIELMKILLRYDINNGSPRNLQDLFVEEGGLERVQEILNETTNEELICSIQELLETFYPE